VYKLENWRIITQFSFNDKNPEELDEELILHGQIDGEWIMTDPLFVFNVIDRVATTKGRYTYKLGATASIR
jgi:hypothetical protein